MKILFLIVLCLCFLAAHHTGSTVQYYINAPWSHNLRRVKDSFLIFALALCWLGVAWWLM